MSTRFWHGFADMHLVKDAEVVIRSAEGVWIETTDGRRLLDSTAALWYCAVGYGRRSIADAVAEQLATVAAYSSFGAYTTEATVALADRLSALAPMDDAVVFLGSGGSDGVDTAAKLARRYWDAVGRPDKRIIVSREHGYHGMHAWGTSLAGIPANKAGYGGAFIDEVVTVGVDDTESLGALFAERGSEIAAFIGEPVVGAGGVYPPEPSYWPEVQRLCREHDVLLIADEVITGFGRTGVLWGSQRYGIEPDMAIFAKVVTSGYQPLGGVLVAPRVAAPFWDGETAGPMFLHGYTYSGHAAACAAAQANLDIIEGEGLVARVAAMRGAVRRGHPPPGDAAARRRGPDGRIHRRGHDRPRPAGGRSQRSRPGSSARRSATGSRRASFAATPCRSRRPSRSPSTRSTRWSTAWAPPSRTSPRPDRGARGPSSP